MHQSTLKDRLPSGGFFSNYGSLNRVADALEKMNSLPLNLGNVILVAGTVGKTTVAKNLARILASAGYRVNALLAGHSFGVEERIILNGKYAQYAELSDNVSKVQGACLQHGIRLNFFETMVLVGAKLFSEVPSDVIIIEYGIGHRDDPINIFHSANVLCQVITAIDVDHEYLLGNTVELNAMHHACAIKPSTTVISAAQKESVINMFQEICKSQNNRLLIENQNYWLDKGPDEKDEFIFSTQTDYIELANLSIFSENERSQIALAIMVAIECCNEFPKVSESSLNSAIKNIWPSEIIPISDSALTSILGAESEILFAAVNNAVGAKLLGKHLRRKNLADLRPKANYGIVCVEHDASGPAMLLALKGLFAKIIAVDFADKDSFLSREDVVRGAGNLNIKVDEAESVEKAISAIAMERKGPLRITLFGSSMVCGKMRKFFPRKSVFL